MVDRGRVEYYSRGIAMVGSGFGNRGGDEDEPFLGRLAARLSLPALWPSTSHWWEFGWVAGGQLFSLALGIASIKLMTSVGPGEYGKFVLASSVAGVLSLSFFGPLEQGYVRLYFLNEGDSRSRNIFLRSLVGVLLASLAVLIPVGALAVMLLQTYYGFDPLFTSSAAAMIVTSVIGIPLAGVLNAMRLRKEVALIQVGERMVLILLLFVMTRVLPPKAAIVMFAVATASAISNGCRLLVYWGGLASPRLARSRQEMMVERGTRNEMLRGIFEYSLPFLLWGGVAWLQSNGERWVINAWMTVSDVGRYGLAWGVINNSAGLGATILSQFLTPIMFRHFSAGDDESLRRGEVLVRLSGVLTLGLFGVAAILLLAFGDAVIAILSTQSFVSGGAVLFALAVGLGLFYVGQALSNLGFALTRPRVYLPAKVCSAVASVPLYLAGCRLGGVLGVACAVIVANALYLLMVIDANRRLRRCVRAVAGV